MVSNLPTCKQPCPIWWTFQGFCENTDSNMYLANNQSNNKSHEKSNGWGLYDSYESRTWKKQQIQCRNFPQQQSQNLIKVPLDHYFEVVLMSWARTTDTQWRHKSKISEKLGRCGRQNMLPPYYTIWEWEWIFGRAVKAIFSLGVRSPCLWTSFHHLIHLIPWMLNFDLCMINFKIQVSK